MNLDELIVTLLAIRAQRGNLPVIVYDGNDPCDLEAISRVETGTQQFFSRLWLCSARGWSVLFRQTKRNYD